MSAERAGRRVTRADVARVAGTSTAVVSYVVNNGPRPVAPATRERVLAAIEQVGYVPDTIAKALASGATGTYGLIVPDIANPFFAALAHAVDEATSAVGKVVLLGDSAESKQRESELIDTFMRRRIDGLLFVGVDNSPALGTLTGNGVPVVILDRDARTADRDDPAAPVSAAVSMSVSIDNVGAARVVTEHLLGHGYTRVGITAGPAGLDPARDRLAGWHDALTAAGLDPDPRWVVEAPFSRRGGLDAGRALFARAGADRPEAVFASNEQQAIGLLVAADEAGLRVPADVAVISFDGTEASEYCVPRLSGVVQPLGAMARTAVELLGRAAGAAEPVPAAHVLSDYELRIRPSCGPHDGAVAQPFP
ncbi:LacI family DNA-binding transcriptional regulator [Pseudonocardia phyllosphaerae]|uniref:LacI family DNA-binding transcriptional regulator n=1 Tax=Pseudonocardia phyllosphaerae TaxID=3390502 RepID=UPI00397B6434